MKNLVPIFLLGLLALRARADSGVDAISDGFESGDPQDEGSSAAEDSAIIAGSYDPTGSGGESSGLISFEQNTSLEQSRNYMRISADLKTYQDSYEACVSAISVNDFSQAAVDRCTGAGFVYVADDIDYVRRKILARVDAQIREDMIALCYKPAGVDLVASNACDLVENDALDLLWAELDFQQLLDHHRAKYLFNHAKMNATVFTQVNNRFKDLYAALSELITELYAHKSLVLSELQKLIDERSLDVSETRQAQGQLPLSNKISITIDSALMSKPVLDRALDPQTIPRPVALTGRPQTYELRGNPNAQRIAAFSAGRIKRRTDYSSLLTPPNVRFTDLAGRRRLVGPQRPRPALRSNFRGPLRRRMSSQRVQRVQRRAAAGLRRVVRRGAY